MKRYLIMALALVLLLSSCGQSNEVGGGNAVASTGKWISEGGAYKIAEEAILNGASCILSRGDEVCTLSAAPDQSGNIRSQLRCGSELIYSPLNALINCAALDSDSVWILEYGFDGESSTSILKKISASGDTIKEISLENYLDFCKGAYTMLCSNGKIYLSNGKDIRTWYDDGRMGEAHQLKDVERLELVTSSDGNAYAVCYYPDSTEVMLINGEALESVLTIKTVAPRIFKGTDAGAFVLADDRGLFNLNSDGSTSPILIWKDCGISPMQIKCLSYFSNGDFLCLDSSGVKRLTPTDPSKLNHKTELILATVDGGDGLKVIATNFNLQSENYYISIKDYSEGGNYDTETAISRLNTDIIGGKHPDLLSFTGLSPFSYINKGYIVDLTEFIENCPDLDRQDIVIFDKLKVNDGVYYLSNCFNIMTLVARHSEFGDKTGWTLDEYLQIEKNLPSGTHTMYNTTKANFLRRLSSRYLSTAIDWSLGTCNFQNDEFYSILEASRRINENPESNNAKDMDFTYPSVRVANGSLVAVTTWVENVGKLAFEEKMAKCKLSYIGWPTVDGSCGSDIYISQPVGICAKTDNPEGSWEFLKYMLMNADPYDSGKIPAYAPNLQAQIEKAQNDESYLGILISEEDTARFYSLLDSIETVGLYDQIALDIIEEEAAAFFAGDKTAEETAKIIQQRVSLYVAEQS